MNFKNIHNVYFVGIGGIGMSALARYFLSKDCNVAGYDRVSTPLTQALEDEGAIVQYNDAINEIPKSHKYKDTLVVYTPAIPKNNEVLSYFKNNEFTVLKRSQVLGKITENNFTVGVAGTHGKTTTSSIISYLIHYAGIPCDAFLGGISVNFNSNVIFFRQAKVTVVEADEYDRSFLTLSPDIAVVTSTDADHLDIYGGHDSLLKSFQDYVNKLSQDGTLIVKKGLKINHANTLTYSLNEEANFFASDIELKNGMYQFTLHTPQGKIEQLSLGLAGLHNVENAIAAVAVALQLGISEKAIREGLKIFKGIKRRFEYILNSEDLVFIDDYAHHPTELKACITSARAMFPGKKITGVFQPHLYSRTRDFADGFAQSLELLDKVFLLDIYPARELPIAGVDSAMLLDKIKGTEKELVNKQELVNKIKTSEIEVLLTLGAGDIDTLVEPLKQKLEKDLCLK